MRSEKENSQRERLKVCLSWFVGYLLLSTLFGFLVKINLDDYETSTMFIVIMSFSVVLSAFLLVCILFGNLTFKNGLFDFIIGDEGTYSLSRLQAVMWGITVMASQVQTIEVLFFNHSLSFYDYQPIFSDSSIWLLALSMSSYIAVKGLTLTKIESRPKYYKKRNEAHWKDILTGSNGLDFSKCQMLIWTIIALGVYISKCYAFENQLLQTKQNKMQELLTHHYDEYEEKRIDPDPGLPFVPYIPWSFVVLMGLSQGAYVGKKLVPSFQLDDIKVRKQQELFSLTQDISLKKAMLIEIHGLTKANGTTEMDLQNLESITEEIEATQNEIKSLSKDIDDIEEFNL
jgi:hypothetical protein